MCNYIYTIIYGTPFSKNSVFMSTKMCMCKGNHRWRRRRAGREREGWPYDRGYDGGRHADLEGGEKRGGFFFRGNGMEPARTRKRDPRKLKGGTAVVLCLKRQFAGLRYGLYITAQLLRMVGDSSVDSELLLFCAKGDSPREPHAAPLFLSSLRISPPGSHVGPGASYSPTT